MLCVGTDTQGALRGNDVKAGGMNRRRAPIGGHPHAERRDENRVSIFALRNSKFEIRNYPGSDALRRNRIAIVILVPMLCVGTSVICYSFDIRNLCHLL